MERVVHTSLPGCRAQSFSLSDLKETYACLDPASTKVKVVGKEGARPAISVVSADADGRIFWRYSWAKRVDINLLVEQIHFVQTFYQPSLFGCEANAMQSLFADMLDRESKFRNQTLPLVAITQPTNIDKVFRVRTLLHPVIGQGALLIGPDVPDEHVKEVISFPTGKFKDVPDVLASCIELVPERSTQAEVEEKAESASRWSREASRLYGGRRQADRSRGPNGDVFAGLVGVNRV